MATVQFITREEWGARPPKKPGSPLDTPVEYVAVNFCIAEDPDTPAKDIVKELQKRDMFKGLLDIQANFLISKNGEVFEGRGWDTRPGFLKVPDPTKQHFLQLTYLGDFSAEEMEHPAYTATGALLEVGVRQKKLLSTASFIAYGEDPDTVIERLPAKPQNPSLPSDTTPT